VKPKNGGKKKLGFFIYFWNKLIGNAAGGQRCGGDSLSRMHIEHHDFFSLDEDK
jgi:hypothetical protein